MSLIALCGAVVASGCLFPTEQEPDTGRRAAEFQTVASVQEATLLPLADTYLRQGSPNQSQGADPILRLQASGNNRALLRFDRAAIAAAVGAGTLQGARLELTIAFNADNWGSAGRTIDLHRLTQGWTETGATWNCADDANPANQSADCEGETAWQMGGSGPHPWEPLPAATVTITNGLTGVVSLDVTAELAAVLAGGGEHHGWILKKTLEGQEGRVEFGSRESGTSPRLVLEVSSQQVWPILSGVLPPFDTTRVVALPSGHLLYRTDITLRFKDTVSDSAKAAFLGRHGMAVIGVAMPRKFLVKIPDPGLTLDSFFTALRRIRNEPEVQVVTFIDRSPPLESIDARHPEDDQGGRRHPSELAASDREGREIGALPRSVEKEAGQEVWPTISGIMPLLDTSRVIAPAPGSATLFYRTEIILRFRSGVTVPEKALFFARHGMVVVAAMRSDRFIVRWPDPGPSFASFQARLDLVEAEPGIEGLAPILRSPLIQQIHVGVPDDRPIRLRSSVTPGPEESGILMRFVLALAVGDTNRPPVPTSLHLPNDPTRSVAAPWGTREHPGEMRWRNRGWNGCLGGHSVLGPSSRSRGTYDGIDRVADEIEREPACSPPTFLSGAAG